MTAVRSRVKLARPLLPFAAVFLTFACDAAPTPTPEPAAATAPKPEPFDLVGYCAAMCERTTTCGLQSAEASAALGGKKTEDALRKAKADTQTSREDCVVGCGATPIDDDNRGAALRAKRCLGADACADLEKCLALL
jgi:hypothetical protein